MTTGRTLLCTSSVFELHDIHNLVAEASHTTNPQWYSRFIEKVKHNKYMMHPHSYSKVQFLIYAHTGYFFNRWERAYDLDENFNQLLILNAFYRNN